VGLLVVLMPLILFRSVVSVEMELLLVDLFQELADHLLLLLKQLYYSEEFCQMNAQLPRKKYR
jgi:hypothetical protein